MRRSWKEMWSSGEGARSRTYCVITRTTEGFAVDLLKGDACIDSTVHASRADAERTAMVLKQCHDDRAPVGSRRDWRDGQRDQRHQSREHGGSAA